MYSDGIAYRLTVVSGTDTVYAVMRRVSKEDYKMIGEKVLLGKEQFELLRKNK